jgi:pimeloyl-ACP methyl ester carboxylesterase
MHPSVFDPIEGALEPDFRVVRFDERGTGQSDRTGPYDMEAGVSDLEDICETLGGVAVALCLVDAANRAVRVAEARPDLLDSVVCVGSAPFGVGALKNSDSLLASEAVIGAYLQQLDADYRGAVGVGGAAG